MHAGFPPYTPSKASHYTFLNYSGALTFCSDQGGYGGGGGSSGGSGSRGSYGSGDGYNGFGDGKQIDANDT